MNKSDKKRGVKKFNDFHRPYALTIGSSPKFVWFRNAKVGTRTMLNILRKSTAEFEVEESFGVHFEKRRLKNHFKFAIVRNPWDRLISGWQNKFMRETKFAMAREHRQEFKNFGAFVEYIVAQDPESINIHFRPQVYQMDLNELNFLGRFENFEDCVHVILKNLDLTAPPAIPKINATVKKKHYSEFYDDRLLNMVGEYYHKDVQMFGYSFERKIDGE
jgi:hypothetical protein